MSGIDVMFQLVLAIAINLKYSYIHQSLKCLVRHSPWSVYNDAGIHLLISEFRRAYRLFVYQLGNAWLAFKSE